MSREIVIGIIFATLVIFAISMLVDRLRTLEEQIRDLSTQVSIISASAATQTGMIKETTNMFNRTYVEMREYINKKCKDTDSHLTEIINKLGTLGKIDDIDDYVKMMDDTVIATIRDEYEILDEIKKRFLTLEKNDGCTVGAVDNYLSLTNSSEEHEEAEPV